MEHRQLHHLSPAYRERLAAAAAMHHAPNTLVSRILQVALGLFVTTADLPGYPASSPALSFDCSFDSECRWASVGTHFDRWKVARGEPDSLLWLAATGTMQLPTEPFALVEIRGQPTDMLISDVIGCQDGTSSLSFSYWAIGNADLEICLTDEVGVRFNCTGMLESPVMPGKVLLKIPEIQRPFRIMIAPNTLPGILIVDEIRYDGQHCENIKSTKRREATTQPALLPEFLTSTMMPTTTTITTTTAPPVETSTDTPEPTTVQTTTTAKMSFSPLPMFPEIATTVATIFPVFTTPPPERSTRAIDELSGTASPIDLVTPSAVQDLLRKKMEQWRTSQIARTTTTPSTTTEFIPVTRGIPSTTTDVPFDLMIYGNRTWPFFDRRLSMIVGDSSKLLCDFKEEFPCQWGVEAGKWAIVREGAIPSLEEDIGADTLPPTFPAALVLQGTVMLTSDPVRCQTGSGKVLFRYWSNGNVSVQVCALGYGIDNNRIECHDRQPPSLQDSSLAVFEIPNTIREPFTLNIVPQWAEGARNKYLLIDEVAYIGECTPTSTSTASTTTMSTTTTTTTTAAATTLSAILSTRFSKRKTVMPVSTATEESETAETETREEEGEKDDQEEGDDEQESQEATTLPPTKYSKYKKTPRVYPLRTITTTPATTIAPSEEDISEESFIATLPTTLRPYTRYTGTPSGGARIITTTPKPIDYCALLNCNFDDNACNYLNHGLTKVPWTLRNRGYGYPLSGQTDVRPTQSNGQFVSALLTPGDIAILESPKFNLSSSLNVLLFQYYRPTQSSTIRLCLGSRYTTPLRTVAAFSRCPSILRAVTARNAYRWNTVHVQLPPGTTHFFLVAHNSERAEGRTAVALDNMRVAICDPKNFAPEEVHQMFWPTPSLPLHSESEDRFQRQQMAALALQRRLASHYRPPSMQANDFQPLPHLLTADDMIFHQ